MTISNKTNDRNEFIAATSPEFARFMFVSEPTSLILPGEGWVKAMYRLCCRECGEPFEENETPVPSRSIKGAPLVHEECAE